MRIRIEVHSALGTFVLPQGYNPYVQGLINACIPTDIPWPGEAQGAEEGHFKLFTFSQLYARSVERIDVSTRSEEKGDERVRYQLVMSSPVWFYLSSPSKDFIDALMPRLEHSHDLHIERNLVEAIHVSKEPSHAETASGQVSWRIRTISPVTVYQVTPERDIRPRTMHLTTHCFPRSFWRTQCASTMRGRTSGPRATDSASSVWTARHTWLSSPSRTRRCAATQGAFSSPVTRACCRSFWSRVWAARTLMGSACSIS